MAHDSLLIAVSCQLIAGSSQLEEQEHFFVFVSLLQRALTRSLSSPQAAISTAMKSTTSEETATYDEEIFLRKVA
jgi:hypothetical protein